MKKNLEAVLDNIAKEYKNTSLACVGSTSMKRFMYLDGLHLLSEAIGGGLQAGKRYIFWGKKGGAKSTVALIAIAAVQRTCRVCGARYKKCDWVKTGEHVKQTGEVIDLMTMKLSGCMCKDKKGIPCKAALFDVERTYDWEWALKWGVDVTKLVLIEPEYAEQVADIGMSLIASEDVDIIVVDSVGAMKSKVQMEASAENKTYSGAASIIGDLIAKWSGATHSIGVEVQPALIFINQVRDIIGGYHPGLKMPGGHQLVHLTDCIVRLKPKDAIKHSTQLPVGREIDFITEYCKLAPPGRSGTFGIYFVDDPTGNEFRGGTTDEASQVIQSCLWWRLAEKTTNGHYTVKGIKKKLHGKKGIQTYFSKPENHAQLDTLRAEVSAIEQQYRAGLVIAPRELREGMLAALEEDDD